MLRLPRLPRFKELLVEAAGLDSPVQEAVPKVGKLAYEVAVLAIESDLRSSCLLAEERSPVPAEDRQKRVISHVPKGRAVSHENRIPGVDARFLFMVSARAAAVRRTLRGLNMPKSVKEKLADIEATEREKTAKAAEEAAAKRTALKADAEAEYKSAVAALREVLKPLQSAVDEAAEAYHAVTGKYPTGYGAQATAKTATSATGTRRGRGPQKPAPTEDVVLDFMRRNPDTNRTAVAAGLPDYSEGKVKALVNKLIKDGAVVSDKALRGETVKLNAAK